MAKAPYSTRHLVLDVIDMFLERTDFGLCECIDHVALTIKEKNILDGLLHRFKPLKKGPHVFWWGDPWKDHNVNVRLVALAFMLAIAEAEEKEHA